VNPALIAQNRPTTPIWTPVSTASSSANSGHWGVIGPVACALCFDNK
jgi:hypothetical protein